MTGRTLFFYVARRAGVSLLIAFLVVTSIIMLVDFVEATRNLDADSEIGSFRLLGLTALKAPSLIEQTIPFVVLFGMMGAIYGMNRRSELIVMRASGQSAWTIIRPALWLAALIGLFWAAVLNPVAVTLYDQYETLSDRWTSSDSVFEERDIWLREGRDDHQIVIRARGANLSDVMLIDATFLRLDVRGENGETQFARRYDASRAVLSSRGSWQLFDVIENAPGEAMQRHDTISLPTSIDADTLAEQAGSRARAGFWDMPRTIVENERAGFSAQALRLAFNRLLSLPVMLIAMTFIAAGVSMSLAREGGTMRLLITGAALGFAVFFADSMVSAFGEVSIIPVYIAAWSVPLIVLAMGISYLAKIEDG